VDGGAGGGSAAALVTLYYLLPLDHASTPAAVTMLLIGLVAFIALVAVQVRLIVRSPHPGLRAAESLATSVPDPATSASCGETRQGRAGCTRAGHDHGSVRLAVRAGGLADSGAHPIVGATGSRAGPAVPATCPNRW
jgi:hypothetical protein